jgi:hypothetical protein
MIDGEGCFIAFSTMIGLAVIIIRKALKKEF